MANLLASWFDHDGANTNTLTTPTFVPAVGDLIVVKTLLGDSAMTVNTPTGGGLTWTQRIQDGTASHVRAAIWTAVSTGSSVSPSLTFPAGPTADHSMVVEWWEFATVASSPVTVDVRGSGTPAGTLTSTATDSLITWASGDWSAIDGAGRTYDSTTEYPTEQAYITEPGIYTAYFAFQAVPSPSSHNLGVTSPTGQTWTLVGLEILDAGGAILLDPLPQALYVHPPGRISPRGGWTPLAGRDDAPKRTAAPVWGTPAQTTWNVAGASKATTVGGTGSGSLSWVAGDTVLVLGVTADQATTLNTPTATGLTFTALGLPVTTGNSCWGQRWTAVAAAAGSGAVTGNAANTTVPWGIIAWSVSGSDGVGQQHCLAGVNGLTQPVTTTDDHSSLHELIGDWGAAAVAGLTWTPTGQTQRQGSNFSPDYSVFAADWADQGTAGIASYGIAGITASGQNYTRVVVEMLGRVAAAPAATAVWEPSFVSQYTGYF